MAGCGSPPAPGRGRTECSSHVPCKARDVRALANPVKCAFSFDTSDPNRMNRHPSPLAAVRFAIPRTLMAGFILAALATLVIGIVNFRSAETRTEAVRAMDRSTLSMRQLNLFTLAIKDAETGQRGYL